MAAVTPALPHPTPIPPVSPGTYEAVQLTHLSSSFDEGISGLELRTLARRELEPDEIRVRVHAAALNFFDLLMLQGKYQFKPSLPFTVGSEASGVIIEIGCNVKAFRVGDEVIAGMSNGDAMASEMIVHASRVIRKPRGWKHAEAAAFPVGFFTGYHALVHRGHLKAGEYLLVTGAGGGMGLSCVQLGVWLGAKVIALASTEAKCEAARRAGAHHTIMLSHSSPASTLQTLKDQVSQITNGRMIDVCYDVVGGKAFMKELIRCMAGNGRLLVVGFASGEIPSIPANLVLVKGFSLVGVRSGHEMIEHPELAHEMIRVMNGISDNDRQLVPAVRTVAVDQFREAYRWIAEKKIIGKAVVLWQPEKKAKL